MWGAPPGKGVDVWLAEDPDWDMATRTCRVQPEAQCRHFTLIVWETVQQVGCSWEPSCIRRDPDGDSKPGLLTCRYWPKGTWRTRQGNMNPYGRLGPRDPAWTGLGFPGGTYTGGPGGVQPCFPR